MRFKLSRLARAALLATLITASLAAPAQALIVDLDNNTVTAEDKFETYTPPSGFGTVEINYVTGEMVLTGVNGGLPFSDGVTIDSQSWMHKLDYDVTFEGEEGTENMTFYFPYEYGSKKTSTSSMDIAYTVKMDFPHLRWAATELNYGDYEEYAEYNIGLVSTPSVVKVRAVQSGVGNFSRNVVDLQNGGWNYVLPNEIEYTAQELKSTTGDAGFTDYRTEIQIIGYEHSHSVAWGYSSHPTYQRRSQRAGCNAYIVFHPSQIHDWDYKSDSAYSYPGRDVRYLTPKTVWHEDYKYTVPIITPIAGSKLPEHVTLKNCTINASINASTKPYFPVNVPGTQVEINGGSYQGAPALSGSNPVTKEERRIEMTNALAITIIAALTLLALTVSRLADFVLAHLAWLRATALFRKAKQTAPEKEKAQGFKPWAEQRAQCRRCTPCWHTPRSPLGYPLHPRPP